MAKLHFQQSLLQYIKCHMNFNMLIWFRKESYDAFLKIIILCIWCNRICWHALMLKKHMIFQILYIIVGPLCPASLKRFVLYKFPPSDKHSLLWLGNWPSLGCNGSLNSRFDSIRHSGVMVRYVFYTGGNWLYVAMFEIYVLNHEGEPMDITQACVCTRVCTMQTKCNIYAGEHLNQSFHYNQKVKVKTESQSNAKLSASDA